MSLLVSKSEILAIKRQHEASVKKALTIIGPEAVLTLTKDYCADKINNTTDAENQRFWKAVAAKIAALLKTF